MIDELTTRLGAELWSRLSEPLVQLAEQSRPDSKIWVAFSGGADSTLLLLIAVEVMRELQRSHQLVSIHVDHGVHPESGVWAQACQHLAQALGLPCHVVAIQGDLPLHVSVEAWLREQRYKLLADCLGPTDHLLTAHHQDDQAETLLLQALRGGGLSGLAAMTTSSKLGRGRLVRPWIDVARKDIRRAVQQLNVPVINDPSNDSLRFDRNYLRKAVVPELAKRWPQWASCLSRAARWQSEAQQLLDEYAAHLCQSVNVELAIEERLPISRVNGLSPEQLRLVLRYWLRHLGLAVGTHRHIRELEKLIASAPDSHGVVRWAGVQVRRHANWLYAEALSANVSLRPDPETSEWHWDLSEPCDFGVGSLQAQPMLGRGLRASLLASGVVVRLRTGGERIRPVGDRHNRTVKRLLQERGIPVWERAALPMLYVAEELVAVADLWMADGAEAGPQEAGWLIHWKTAGRLHEQP